MKYTYKPEKNIKLGVLTKLREWKFDEPCLMASHPRYEFLITENPANYSFFVTSANYNEEIWKKTQKELGFSTDDLIIRGRFGLSPGAGRINVGGTPIPIDELTTMHIVPLASRLSDNEAEILLDRFEPEVFQHYKKLYPNLKDHSRRNFF